MLTTANEVVLSLLKYYETMFLIKYHCAESIWLDTPVEGCYAMDANIAL